MKRQEILTILIPTFICIVAWIGFNIYHSAVTSTISSQEVAQIAPINPSFNTKIIDELKKRERVDAILQGSSSSATLIISIPTPTPTPEEAPIASESAVNSTGSANIDTGGVIE